MKISLVIASTLLLTSCSLAFDSIDSDAEAIDVYCQAFNNPLNDDSQARKEAAISYLKESPEEMAKAFVVLTEKTSGANPDQEAFLLLVDICGSRG